MPPPPRIEWLGTYCFCPVCLFVCLSVCLLSTLTFAITFEPFVAAGGGIMKRDFYLVFQLLWERIHGGKSKQDAPTPSKLLFRLVSIDLHLMAHEHYMYTVEKS